MFTRSRAIEQNKLAQFGLVGLVNTAAGYLVIVAALSLGANDFVANASGYAIGLTISYLLNSKWTFRNQARLGFASAARYLGVFFVAYGANLLVIVVAGGLGYQREPLVHLIGTGLYVTLFFLGARSFVFGDWSATRWPAFIQSRWPEMLAVGTSVLAWAAMWNISLSHDVVWQLWIARQMLGGAELYRDILEINPPLWFWMAMPVQHVAQAMGIAPKVAIVGAVFGHILMATLAVSALAPELDSKRRAVLLAVVLAAMIIIPLTDFGQREHLALIGAIPYTLLAARRAKGSDVHWLLPLVVGVLAAPGFALKHYFIAVPVLLELWVLYERRRSWSPFRSETIALAGAALLYGAAIWFIAPDYLIKIVPMVKLAYFGYDSTLAYQLFKPFVLFWLFVALICFKYRSRLHPMAKAAAIAGVGFMLSYFLQGKGFNYHALSATGMMFISMGSLLPIQRLERSALRTVVGVMLMPILVTAVRGAYSNPYEERILHLLEGTERGRTVMMLASNPSTIWPMVEQQGYIWPSRHFAPWMLTTFGREMRRSGQLSPAIQEFAREVRVQMVEDLACNPPDVILVDDLRATKARGLNAIAFFSENEDFRAFFAHYKKTRIWGNFTSYVKDPRWDPVRPPSCRRIY